MKVHFISLNTLLMNLMNEVFQHLIFYKGLSISLNSCMVPLLTLNSLYVYEHHVYVDVLLWHKYHLTFLPYYDLYWGHTFYYHFFIQTD